MQIFFQFDCTISVMLGLWFMNKLLWIVVLGLLLCINVYADNFKTGQIIENELRFSKKVSFSVRPSLRKKLICTCPTLSSKERAA